MRRSVVWIRRIGFAVLAVLVSLCLTLYWLLGTTSGTRFAANQLTTRVDGLAVTDVQGSFLDGIALTGLRYTANDIDLRVASLTTQIDPSILWNFRRVGVDRFKAQGIVLTLPPAAPAREPEELVIPLIKPLALPLRIDVDQLQLLNLAIVSAGSDKTDATVIDEVFLRGSVDGSDVDIVEARLEQKQWSLATFGFVTVNEVLPATLEFDWTVTQDSSVPIEGKLRLSGDRMRYQIVHDLRSPYVVESRGHVSVPIDEPITVLLESVSQQVTLRGGDAPLRLDSPKVVVAGSYGDWSATLDAGLSGDLRVEGDLKTSLSGVFNQPISASADLKLDNGGAVKVTGTPEGLQRFNGDVTLEALPLALFAPSVSGELSGRYEIGIDTTNGLAATAEIVETAGSISNQTIFAKGALAYRQNVVDFSELVLEVGNNSATTNGSLDLNGNLSLSVNIDAPELGGLIDDLSGTLIAESTIGGTASRPVISARIEPSSVVYRDYRVEGLEATVAWSGEQGDLELAANELKVGERTVSRFSLTSDGSLQDHRVALSASLDNSLAVATAFAGGYDQARWQGVVNEFEARPLKFSEQLAPVKLQSPVTVDFSSSQVDISAFCLLSNDAISVCGEGRWADNQLVSKANIELPDVAVFAQLLLPTWTVSGELSGSFELAGPIDRLNGEGQLSVPELSVARVNTNGNDKMPQTVNVAPIETSFQLRDGALSLLAAAVIEKAANMDVDLTLNDWLSPSSALAGKVTIDSEQLDGLNGLHDAIVFKGGVTDITVTIAGTRSAPLLSSDARINALNVTLIPLGISLQDVAVTANANSSDRVAATMNGRSGDGGFSLDALVSLDGDDGPRLTGKLNADRFRFIDLPDMKGVASLGLTLDANPQGYKLEGDVTVDEASVTVRELPAGAVRVSSDSRVYDSEGELVVHSDAGALSGALDLSIRLSEQVQLAGFGLRTALSGDLALKQVAGAAPTGVGTLTLSEATYAAYGQKLDVSRGRLIFNGPLDEPRLDVRALREVDDYTVGIDVTGTPSALQSTLFSTPSLPDAEAFSLLLTGRNLGATSAGDGAGLADAALTLGLRQALGVTDGIREAVGLDSLTIAGSGRNGRLLAGKSLSSNLYLQYAYGVFDQVSSVLLRLKINDRLSLESSSGETQSVDLIYSVGR